MKQFLFIALLIFLGGCSKKRTVEVKESFPDGSPKVVAVYEEVDENTQDMVEKTVYYENGKKKEYGTYEDGRRHGKWTSWYKDGTVWSTGYYKNGKREGHSVAYYPNGQKLMEGEYQDGEQHGTWKFWDQNGKLVKTQEFN